MGWTKKLKRAAKAVSTFGYSEVKPARDVYRKNSAGINTVATAAVSFVAPPVGAAMSLAIKAEASRKAKSQWEAEQRRLNQSPVFDEMGYYTQADSYPGELPGVNGVSQLYGTSNRQPPYLRAQAQKRLDGTGATRDDSQQNMIAAVVAGLAIVGVVWAVTK